MKVTMEQIGGTVVKDNETYRLTDNRILPNLVFSKTELHPGKSTNGHKHDGLDEVYIFMKGHGQIDIDEQPYAVGPGDVLLIPGGKFHRVHNHGPSVLEFNCIFQSYER